MIQTAIKRVMVEMMLADGVIDHDEIAMIQRIYGKVAGQDISEEDVRAAIDEAERDRNGVSVYVKKIAPELNDDGKEVVLRTALAVAAADGIFQEEEKELLTEIAAGLGMSAAQVDAILAEMLED